MNISIKILGAGCKSCQSLYEVTKQVVEKHEIQATVEKIEDFEEMIPYNILGTPALVINEKVKSVGKIPSESQLLEWIQNA